MTLDLTVFSWTLPKAQGTKEKIDKLDYVKIKIFCASKDTINRVKSQSSEWEKIFTNHISDKGSICRIYKELIQFNTTKTQPILKMGKGFEQTLQGDTNG